MGDVPPEIFREILVRLPAESLFRLRTVCKKWLRIIGDSSFIKDHTNNQLHSHTHTLLLRNRYASALLYSFSLDSLNFTSGPQMIDATRIKQTRRSGRPLLPHLFSAPSCNGLILVFNFDTENENVWAICNPLTREFHELPQPNAGVSWGLCGLGFGYDCVDDDYKVVRIDKFFPGRRAVFQTLIYSLKLDSWRKIDDCPRSRPCNPRLAASLNGTLYWKSGDVIVALDLNTEIYSQLPLPPVDSLEICNLILDSLDGCLICSLYDREMHLFDGWVMKDNGVEKLWVKLFSLQCPCDKEFKIVAYLKAKEQVVLQHDWGFMWFDIGNNSVKKFSIHGISNIATSQIFHGSLVRLDGRAIGAKRKRKANTDRTDTRLKFCVRNVEEICCSDNKSCSEDSCRLCKEE